jgi:hypothetical protein
MWIFFARANMPLCPLCKETRLYGQYATVYGACRNCCQAEVRACGRAEILVKSQLDLLSDEFDIRHNQTDPRTRKSVAPVRADFRLTRTNDALHDIVDVVIEVDEQQHRVRPPAAEMQRMLKMIQASGGKPHLIFRLNPDDYKNITGKHSRGITAREYIETLRSRVEFMIARIKLRECLMKRRMKANPNYQVPMLYVEYLYFDSSISNPKYHSFYVRHYQSEQEIAACIKRLQ